MQLMQNDHVVKLEESRSRQARSSISWCFFVPFCIFLLEMFPHLASVVSRNARSCIWDKKKKKAKSGRERKRAEERSLTFEQVTSIIAF